MREPRTSEPFVVITGPAFGPQHATADELARQLPSARLFSLDEHVRSDVEPGLPDADSGPYLAPVTLHDHRVLHDLLGRIRDQGHDVRHVALVQTRDDVRRRLRPDRDRTRTSSETQGRTPFAEMAGLVETTGRSVSEVAGAVAAAVGLRLPG